ncbi:uncharacterized protein FIESC28_00651 [Fusarium coffeatum]|uniref:Calpain catalytic domain-containing protein n=1 Tax=Fusarium coffeatum TaxID=231269 RepID=A0A366SB28_9HYPO|nr:uncharacterized protein FIESC28_00651 [Fusarium coffeatum]RBR26534.1 hypothetical protein FIESC28_00651 [Fusarium coffeatum]
MDIKAGVTLRLLETSAFGHNQRLTWTVLLQSAPFTSSVSPPVRPANKAFLGWQPSQRTPLERAFARSDGVSGKDRDWDLVSLQNLLSMRDPFPVIDSQTQAFDLADKGHCLNGLRNTVFDLGEISHLDAGSNSPGAVRRVHEIFPCPTFMRKVDGKDVKQGKLSNCWFVAGLTALANIEDRLSQTCAAYDTEIGVYGFVFYHDGAWTYTIIDDTLYLQAPCWDSPSIQRTLLQQTGRVDAEDEFKQTHQTGSKALFFGQCTDQNETWVPLIEKAYAKAHGDYAALAGGWIGEGLEDLSGGVTMELFTSDILDLDVFWDSVLSQVNQEFLLGASTGFLDGGYGERDGISEGHAYIVVAAHTLKSGQRLLKLRNPWAHVRKGIWEGAWSDGSKEWTPEIQKELDHQFGSDSVFWISLDDFMRKYSHLDRTRLFREPDWRCIQSWISVNVPWIACYRERFRVALTQESPVVVAVSQLDRRYFNGLHGQYSFHLEFRIDQDGSGRVRRRIVQSHGNYLMARSAAAELPDLMPGTYIVCVRVSAERDNSLESVDEVIKQECKARTENPKLAQVGFAYDVAHSKAQHYITEFNRLDKKRKQESASRCRKRTRRLAWKKRHTRGEILKTQKRKDDAKRRIDQGPSAMRTVVESRKDIEGDVRRTEGASETVTVRHVDTDNVKIILPCRGRIDSCNSEPREPTGEDKSIRKMPTTNWSAGMSKNHEASDSSDSPTDNWEQLYSSDNTTHSIGEELNNALRRRTRCSHIIGRDTEANSTESEDSDGGSVRTPWDAVCCLGIRVYSKDENLTLETILGDD